MITPVIDLFQINEVWQIVVKLADASEHSYFRDCYANSFVVVPCLNFDMDLFVLEKSFRPAGE